MSPIPGEVAAEYDVLRHGVGAHLWRRDVVLVTGPDAASYLQGQCSQDVGSLPVGGSTPSLLLEPDGKLAALLRVTRVGDDEYALDTDLGYAGAVVARLARFTLRTKVEIALSDWPCVALRGDGVAAAAVAAGLTSQTGAALHTGTTWVVPVEWNGTVGLDLLGPDAQEAAPDEAAWCGGPAWEALRVEAGIPVMGAELDGRTIAAEAGLVERTVSFTKGCYTGQELVARLDSRGSKVARRLCGIVPDDLELVPGDLSGVELEALGDGGGPAIVGSVTSAAWCPGLGTVAGIGYVHRSVATGDLVRWSSGADEEVDRGTAASGTARVVALPLAV